MAQTLPPAIEQELQKFDSMRKNFETLQMMSQTMQQEIAEVKSTLDELRKQPDDVVTYKTVGQVMFRVEKPGLVEELDDTTRKDRLHGITNGADYSEWSPQTDRFIIEKFDENNTDKMLELTNQGNESA